MSAYSYLHFSMRRSTVINSFEVYTIQLIHNIQVNLAFNEKLVPEIIYPD